MIRATLGLLLAIATLATVVPSAWAGQFKHVTYAKAGYKQLPYRLIATQLTHSGSVDLAIADWLSENVSILLGNGDGTFQKALMFSAGAPLDVAAGDFNGDGNVDLAITEDGGSGNGAVAIFLGDGEGHFKLSATYTVGVGPTHLAVADFNGDGYPDVAVSDKGLTGTGDVMLFFGNGKGKLQKGPKYKITGNPFGIAAGDLSGNDHLDLAVATFQGETVAILMNDGTGKFSKPSYYSVNGWPTDITIADLRNNGMQDLVVADEASGMDVWLNNGDGTFGNPTTYGPCAGGKCSAGASACTVADLNLDGVLDVACAATIDDSYFFYGKGNGEFDPAKPIGDTIQNQGGSGIASGDFNNDGAPDLAIPIQNYGKVAIMLNTQ